MRSPEEPSVDALFAELLEAGESMTEVRRFLERHHPPEPQVIGLLRLAVPVNFLQYVSITAPWCERPRILGGVVLNPRAPRTLSLRLLGSLYWRDLADVAASPRVQMAVRTRAEALLKEQLPDMRLGDRVALARLATPAVIRELLTDGDAKVLGALVVNPRLKQEELLLALRGEAVTRALIEEVAAASRWRDQYAVRLALVLQVRTPLALSLAQLSSLLPHDLTRVAAAKGVPPLVQAAAQRLADHQRDHPRS